MGTAGKAQDGIWGIRIVYWPECRHKTMEHFLTQVWKAKKWGLHYLVKVSSKENASDCVFTLSNDVSVCKISESISWLRETSKWLICLVRRNVSQSSWKNEKMEKCFYKTLLHKVIHIKLVLPFREKFLQSLHSAFRPSKTSQLFRRKKN